MPVYIVRDKVKKCLRFYNFIYFKTSLMQARSGWFNFSNNIILLFTSIKLLISPTPRTISSLIICILHTWHTIYRPDKFHSFVHTTKKLIKRFTNKYNTLEVFDSLCSTKHPKYKKKKNRISENVSFFFFFGSFFGPFFGPFS